MKRIGLTQRVDVVDKYGERRDCLDQHWASLLLELGYCPIPLANQVEDVDEYLATLSLDGVILTGGNDLVEAVGGNKTTPERDRFEHLLLDVFTTARLPVLGVCRGFQLLNIHNGGGLKKIDNHTSQNHKIKLDPDFFDGCPNPILVNSFHRFAIDDSKKSIHFKAISWADDGTIEAAVHKKLPQFGIMWLPERSKSLAPHDRWVIRAAFGEGRE